MQCASQILEKGAFIQGQMVSVFLIGSNSDERVVKRMKVAKVSSSSYPNYPVYLHFSLHYTFENALIKDKNLTLREQIPEKKSHFGELPLSL